MNTKLIHVKEETDYEDAVALLSDGQVVAFPTETVYGLGALATNEEAVARVFEAKGRPADNPLIVHIHSMEKVSDYSSSISPEARACMEAFWPGPFTAIVESKPNLFAPNVTAGLSTVGLRVPNHPVALKLLQLLDQPVAAPSANRSGKPSPTKAEHVTNDLTGIIPCILDGGETGLGVESTVVDFTVSPPVILRPGGITYNMLRQIVPNIIDPANRLVDEQEVPKAPGMKYTHYAPNAPVIMILRDETQIIDAIQTLKQSGERVALIAQDEWQHHEADFSFSLGSEKQIEQAAHRLYDALRACDQTDASKILIVVPSRDGVGEAVFNRIEKAAGGTWWKA